MALGRFIVSPANLSNSESARVINLTKNIVLADAKLARNLYQRTKGLLGKPGLKPQEGLVIMSCDSIHTFFMRFAIDVAFVNKQNQIIKIYPCLKPWRLSGIHLNSAFCIELPAGTLSSTHTQEGDQLEVISYKL